MYGGVQKCESSQTGTAFGVSRSADTSYKQDAFGGQIGMDLGRILSESAVVFGVTGGYVSSDFTFRNSTDPTSYDFPNGGVYASFVSGTVFAMPRPNTITTGSNHAARLQASAASARVSPMVRRVKSVSALGPTSSTQSQSPVRMFTPTSTRQTSRMPGDFDKLDGLRGKVGLRIGSALEMGGSRAVIYLSGNAVHEFRGTQGLSFTSSGTTFNYANDRLGTYGEGKIGFNINSPVA